MTEPTSVENRSMADRLALTHVMVIAGPLVDGFPSFWSGPDGWTRLLNADVFSAKEVNAGIWTTPPDGEWMSLHTALVRHSVWLEACVHDRKEGMKDVHGHA
jgi:hypothetical protein